MAINIAGDSSPAGNPVQSGCEIKPLRNRTKAFVTKGMRSGCTVVVKDCSHCSAWAKRPYGRPCLRREARTYARGVIRRFVPARPGAESNPQKSKKALSAGVPGVVRRPARLDSLGALL
jgi:hypothetical protein